jgi:Cysteine rich repeat
VTNRLFFAVPALAIALIGSTGLALAQDKPSLRQVCAADAQKLCDASSGRMLRCLRKHQSELSPDCQSALADAIAKHRAQQSGADSGQ